MISFISPTKIEIPRKTKKNLTFYLNLNSYRNTNFHTLNQTKQLYTEMMRREMTGKTVPIKSKYRFTLHRTTNRKCDSSNIYSIVEKYFFDALVAWGCLEDDNDDYVGPREYMPAIYKSEIDGVIIDVL